MDGWIVGRLVGGLLRNRVPQFIPASLSWIMIREMKAAQIRSGIVGGFLWHTAHPAKEMMNNAA